MIIVGGNAFAIIVDLRRQAEEVKVLRGQWQRRCRRRRTKGSRWK